MSNTTPDNGRASSAPPVPFVKRARIRNYKSIAYCDVELGPLTVLVGRNGSGKSNFLDAIAFVSDALAGTLADAIRLRGGIEEVLYRGVARSDCFQIELEMNLARERPALFGFTIVRKGRHGFSVAREWLKVEGAEPCHYDLFHHADATPRVTGRASHLPPDALPPPGPDRLFLVNASGHPRYRAAYDALLLMKVYNFNPASMKALRRPDADGLLDRDGANIASVLGRLGTERPRLEDRVNGYLGAIVPGITDVRRVGLGPMETLEFDQTDEASGASWKFFAESMSDGTLRALGALVAVAQLADGGNPVRLVGIEEPETALHPAASAALMGALQEAAVSRQVVVTTHSPDLLDRLDLGSDCLLAVQMRDGGTEIGPINRPSREAIEEHLFSPGELLRMDQFEPDWRDLERQRQAAGSMNAEKPA